MIMRTSYWLSLALFIVFLTGCSQKEQLNISEQPQEFIGQMENLKSRVTLGEDYMMNWEMKDQLSIFPRYNINNLHEVKSITQSGVANFGQVISYNEEQAENATMMDANYAIYPYYSDNSLSVDEVITCRVPESIEYSGMESSIRKALMVAKSTTNMFKFTNAQGILCLKLNAKQPFKFGKVKSIELVSKTKALSGTANMDYSSTDKPVAVIAADGTKKLTINLDENLQTKLPASQNNEYATYYIPIVVNQYVKDDITMYIYWVEDNIKTYSKSVGIDFTIERNGIYTLTHIIEGESFDGEIDDDMTEN